MGLYSQFKTSSQKELDGIAIEFPEAQNEDGSIPTFVISRMGRSNKAYAKALEAETRPFRRQVELGTMKNEVAEEIFLRVFVGNVLKGWQHVEGRFLPPLRFSWCQVRLGVLNDSNSAGWLTRFFTSPFFPL